jgi:hypothetical protein
VVLDGTLDLLGGSAEVAPRPPVNGAGSGGRASDLEDRTGRDVERGSTCGGARNVGLATAVRLGNPGLVWVGVGGGFPEDPAVGPLTGATIVGTLLNFHCVAAGGGG